MYLHNMYIDLRRSHLAVQDYNMKSNRPALVT